MRFPCFLFLLLSSSLAMAEALPTQFGRLTALRANSDETSYVLKLNDRLLAKYKAENLLLYRVKNPSKSVTYVIVEKWRPGLNCRKEYALLKVSSPMKTSLSASFGDCMELESVTSTSDGVTLLLHSPFIKGVKSRKEQWTWEHEQLRKREVH